MMWKSPQQTESGDLKRLDRRHCLPAALQIQGPSQQTGMEEQHHHRLPHLLWVRHPKSVTLEYQLLGLWLLRQRRRRLSLLVCESLRLLRDYQQ